MDLNPHSHRPRDPLAAALTESDRARTALQRTWADFAADPTAARQFDLLAAMAAELDSLAHIEIARKVRAQKPRR